MTETHEVNRTVMYLQKHALPQFEHVSMTIIECWGRAMVTRQNPTPPSFPSPLNPLRVPATLELGACRGPIETDMPRIEEANSLTLTEYRTKFFPDLHDPITSKGISYHLKLESSSTLSDHEFDECLNLIASSSANDYASSSIGWSPKKKHKEMKLPDLRYILLIHPNPPPAADPVQGFLSFMLTYEDGHEVVYCYELHLAPALQRLGIGKHLMGVMEQVGMNVGVDKSMLTVFVKNQAASRFYEKLGYSTDDYSPEPRKLRNGTVKLPTYTILSKSLRDGLMDDGIEEHG